MYKKKILLFGSNGLVGRPLTKKLKRDFEIIQVLNPYSKQKDLEIDESKIYIDLSKNIDCDKLYKNVDTIIYLCQARKNCYQEGEIDKIYNINTINPYNIALFAIKNKIKNFIYFSTGGVYPFSKIPNKENSIINFNNTDIYVSSKISAEIMLKSLNNHLNVLIFRPFFILGHDPWGERLFSRLLKQIINNEEILIDRFNGVTINPVDVDYVVDCVIKSLKLDKTDVINLSGNKIYSLREIIDLISFHLKIKAKIILKKSISNNDLIGCTKKMESVFGKNTKDFEKQLIKFLNI